MSFGKKKEKEYLGLSHTKKLKMLNTAKKKLELNGMKMGRLMHLVTVLIVILKIKKIKLQLFGLVMIQKILKKFHTNNYIVKFLKLQMG